MRTMATAIVHNGIFEHPMESCDADWELKGLGPVSLVDAVA